MEQRLQPFNPRLQMWYDRGWIQALGPVTTANVLDYFSYSIFWDPQSTNNQLRMQTVFTGTQSANPTEDLKRFTGHEFAVVHAEPPNFFMIQKRERHSPEEVTPVCNYFVMDEYVYPAPDVYDVLSNRLMTAVHSLQSSLNALRAARPTFTPRTGFIWPIVESPSSKPDADGARKREEGGDATVGADMALAKHRQQNNMLLLNAMRTTAAHTNSAATPDWELELQAEPNVTSASGPGSGQGTSPISGTPQGPSVAPLSTSAQAEAQPSRRPSVVVEPSDAPGGVKGIPGAGKKKRKRMSMAQQSAPQID